ncbi:Uma2 family endonuclease, partial [Nocardiopsis umidischolae]|nr:Uma2 family endonuclease [Nocardiopsis umidischolae]
MSIAAVEPEALLSWQFMLRTWEELDVPEGCRAEIIEGALVLVTPPKPEHSQIVWQVGKALTREILRDGSSIAEAEVHQTVDVRVPFRSGLYIPDLLVIAWIQERFGVEACRRYIVSFTRTAEDVAAVHELASHALPPE